MAFVNEHFLQLQGSYLFSEVARKVKAFEAAHPQVRLIRLGIGDVTRPLPQACIEAMCRAVRELADARTFHGYGPEQGYDFLISHSETRLRRAGHHSQSVGNLYQRRSEERPGKPHRTFPSG